MKLFVAVQCREPKSETVATFLYETQHTGQSPALGKSLLPLFDSLWELLPWMRGNGYRLLPMGGGEPWQAERAEIC
jgi:hypothetical protein